ncbi:MAG: hypothetical protein ACKVP7_24410 [Hyphomicrobiaceae bacterium]
MDLEIYTLKARPDLRPHVFSPAFRAPLWPEFMLHDPTALLYFSGPHFAEYLDYAFAVLQDGKIVGRAFSVPFAYGIEGRTDLPEGGWDQVIRWAHADQLAGRSPNAVSALEISILPAARSAGNARLILQAMKANARRLGFSDLYAPVRPNEKHLVPSMPMQEYMALTRADGLPRDAWLRTHVRAGGKIIKVAPYAMTIVGSITEWRRWTGQPFRASGSIAVPGALSLVTCSLEHDVAVYVEPGVWVHHSV